jgi:hypothetical protein
MADKGGKGGNSYSEDAILKAKFRSLAFTSPHRDQRRSEVDEAKQTAMRQRSYDLWKKLNPGYFEQDNQTTSREMQRYEESDFVIKDKGNNRRRDQHTEFVNSIALSRGGK